MKLKEFFRALTGFEKLLWGGSVVLITVSFLSSPATDLLTLLASLIGVTSLMFAAKGHALGQVLIIIFSVLYGVISFYFHYYGEMITYLGMTAPIAVASLITWLRHPFRQSQEVEVANMRKGQIALMLALAVVVTTGFYFLLRRLGNANLVFSTLSVFTSFIASYMTMLRSAFYAVGYAANDLVLIVLWTLATLENRAYFPMIVCFVLFFVNDVYGFLNWRRMRQRQRTQAAATPKTKSV